MEVIRRRQPRLEGGGQEQPVVPGRNGFGGLGIHFTRVENARLFLVLIGAGEALVAASLYIAVVFSHNLTFYASALAGSFGVAGGVYLAMAFLSVWNNTLQKPKLARTLIGNLELTGKEAFADIDSGSAMMAREAAPRLDSGFSVATLPKRMKTRAWPGYGGSHSTKGFVVADPRALPFRDGVLDYASSGFGVRHFKSIGDRAYVLEEMIRTLKPGGSLAVLVRGDPFEASVLFQDRGMVDVESSKVKGFAPRPANVVVARKVFSMVATYELGDLARPISAHQESSYAYAPVPMVPSN